jgi:type IV secretion system protein TrbJ
MRKLLLRGGAILFLPVIVFGQLFNIVSDPVQEAHSAQQMIDDINMIHQAIQTYNEVAAVYNQLHVSAKWINNKNYWLGTATRIVNSNTPDVFGETGTWNGAVNAGINVPGAYSQATEATNPPPFWSAYPIGQSLIPAMLASIDITDGSTPAAMLSVGNSRNNQPLNDAAIQALEATSQDTSPGTNSEVEQLNQIDSGTVLLNRQMEDTNALLTSQTEQQLVANKIQRDALGDAINLYGQIDQTVATQPTAWGNSAATIQGW